MFLLIACHSGGTRAAPSSAQAPGAITAGELRRDLFAFADDSFRGRETGTHDADRAANFLVQRLMALGLEPAGDSLYLQRVPLVRQEFGERTEFVVVQGGVRHALALGADVAPLFSLGAGLPEPKRIVSGELVFAAWGLKTPSLGRDDLAGLDVRGKVVVVLHGAPGNATGEMKQKLEAQTAVSERLARLVPLQPSAIIVLMAGATSNLYRQLLPNLLRSVAPGDAEQAGSDATRPLPMILFGEAKRGSPLLPSGWPDDDRPRRLAAQFSGRVEVRGVPFTAYNVVGVVRGTDPRLAGSYVAFGAHYDHIGVMTPVHGDSIANGADDDGSGTVAMLAVARRMLQQPARRSALFVWHVAEEKGLLGSAYFTAHPTVPIDSVVAQINADMIGRNARDLLYIVGPRAAPDGQSRVLGAIVDSVNARQPQPFRLNSDWDAADTPEQYYQRSDHFNYARRGVPVVFFSTGLHDDYHAVSDEPSKIDYGKLARVSELMFQVGHGVANRESRLK